MGINFSEILLKINAFSFKKMHLKISSGKFRPDWENGLYRVVLAAPRKSNSVLCNFGRNLPEPDQYRPDAASIGLERDRFWYITACLLGNLLAVVVRPG